jgi:hypothetical protein
VVVLRIWYSRQHLFLFFYLLMRLLFLLLSMLLFLVLSIIVTAYPHRVIVRFTSSQQ